MTCSPSPWKAKSYYGRPAATSYSRESDAPRRNDRLTVPRAGYVVSYLQASRERGVEKRLGKGLCVKNNCTSGQQDWMDEEGSPPRLESAQEFEKGFLIGGLEILEFVGGMFRFAEVAENGVKQGDGSAVVHETRVQANTPERGSADFVGGIVEFGDGEVSPGDAIHVLAVMLGHRLDDTVARADIVEKEVAVRVKLLGSEGGINGQGPTIDLCSRLGGGQGLNVTGITANFVE